MFKQLTSVLGLISTMAIVGCDGLAVSAHDSASRIAGPSFFQAVPDHDPLVITVAAVNRPLTDCIDSGPQLGCPIREIEFSSTSSSGDIASYLQAFANGHATIEGWMDHGADPRGAIPTLHVIEYWESAVRTVSDAPVYLVEQVKGGYLVTLVNEQDTTSIDAVDLAPSGADSNDIAYADRVLAAGGAILVTGDIGSFHGMTQLTADEFSVPR